MVQLAVKNGDSESANFGEVELQLSSIVFGTKKVKKKKRTRKERVF